MCPQHCPLLYRAVTVNAPSTFYHTYNRDLLKLPPVLLATAVSALAAQVQLGEVTFVGEDILHSTKSSSVVRILSFRFPTQISHIRWTGIPFAEPPLAELRMKPPVLKLTPEGPSYDATQYKKGCIQPVRSQSVISLPRRADNVNSCLTRLPTYRRTRKTVCT